MTTQRKKPSKRNPILITPGARHGRCTVDGIEHRFSVTYHDRLPGVEVGDTVGDVPNRFWLQDESGEVVREFLIPMKSLGVKWELHLLAVDKKPVPTITILECNCP